MKHKYNLEGVLLALVGYRGVPYPGAFTAPRLEGDYRAQKYELPRAASSRQEYVKGTRLYAEDRFGRWHFMPVAFKHKNIKTSGNKYEIQCAIISISGKKNIIETKMVGRPGSVKELINVDDYKISITGFIESDNGTYPEAGITQLKEIYNINEPVELVSVLTDLIFDDGDQVVITDISFPETPGIETAQAVRIECVTDKPFELTI